MFESPYVLWMIVLFGFYMLLLLVGLLSSKKDDTKPLEDLDPKNHHIMNIEVVDDED